MRGGIVGSPRLEGQQDLSGVWRRDGDVGTCVALRRCVYAQDHMGNCRRGTEVGSLSKSTGINCVTENCSIGLRA